MTEEKRSFRVKLFPFETSVEVSSGTTVLDVIKTAGLPLKVSCGGKGTCGDCVVQVLNGNYTTKPSAALADHLASRGFVLACQTKITDNLTLKLPQFSEFSIKSAVDSKFLEEQSDSISGIHEVNPAVRKVELRLSPPTLEDNYSDLRRLERELREECSLEILEYEYSVLKKLAGTVREEQGDIGVVLFKSGERGTVIDVFPRSAKRKLYGVACDIGTSTVALHLVNLENGEIESTASSLNQQLTCGEDIISRINYAGTPERLKQLHDLIVSTINHLIERTVQSAQVRPSDIYRATFAGNTTMTHLFLNVDPRYIREEPYVPTFNEVPPLLSRDLGLEMHHECRIDCPPAVGSYVGGDITAGLLCAPFLRGSEKISMFIDAGTNGELVVGNKEWLMTCACSAGPAFEGRGTKFGMPASEGAIEELRISGSGQLEYEVINNTKPQGLCGSGLIDLLAELFVNGYIDRQGKFDEKKGNGCIVEVEDTRGFLVEEEGNTYWGKALVITENDIMNLIRTKGAIFSACSLLLKNVGLCFNDVDSFYIAGGFGQRLNIENAIRIGLLPDLERERFHYLGNSSLIGAYLMLLSDKNRNMVNDIAQKMTYVELNTEPGYMNEYTGALFLPHTDMKLFPSIERMFNP
jgi:uncharacterized 2Fe-2S/4Fe-4S cluster protein (DUF4445 family)